MSPRLQTPEQTERRLRDIAAAARIEVVDFTWESRSGSGTNLLEQIA
jgi:hypothetical protein